MGDEAGGQAGLPELQVAGEMPQDQAEAAAIAQPAAAAAEAPAPAEGAAAGPVPHLGDVQVDAEEHRAASAAEDEHAAADGDDDLAMLPPDHPLLRRAQEALHRQLAEQKLRLEEELRERRKALKDAKQRREDVGVELYGFQQHLAKLQLALERAGDAHAEASRGRAEADGTLGALRSDVAAAEAAAAEEEARAEELQAELDGLAATLRAIQRHNEEAAAELAAAKRATYATEGAVAAAEKAKREQDYLIDGMQAQLRRLGRTAAVQGAALEAQRAETRAAQELLAQALANMEGVAFEKKQLLGQWRASLAAMAQRDAAYEALQDTLRQQQEQRSSMLTEQEGYRRQLGQQRQRNEQAGEVERKLEGQAARLAEQIARVQARQADLKASYADMQRQLAERQQQLAAASSEAARLASQKAQLEREAARLAQESAALDRELLERLGEQTFAEKGGAAALREIHALRARVAEREAAAEAAQAALDRLDQEVEAVQGGNARLEAVLRSLEGSLADKAAGVAALEGEVKAGHADVEAKTRALDQLNRRYQRLLDNAKDVETGPLEATIVNLQREIAAKAAAGRDLQRRWIGVQGQLVALQAENAEAAEAVAAMRAQQAVMQQKRARLNGQLEAQQREARALAKALAALHSETSRLNGLLAEAAGLRSALHEDNLLLEGKLQQELKALEARWASLNASIEELRAERAEVVAGTVEAEREVLVWERRVQLEKEMQEAVDPAYGGDELAALRKEVQRLGHAAKELARAQEGLVADLERAVAKREVIGTKARVSQSARIQEVTQAQARRQAAELAKSVSTAEREGRAAAGRLAVLGETMAELEAAASAAGEQCAALQQAEAGVRKEIEALGWEKYKALVATSAKQREAKRYEDAEAGRYKPAAPAAALQGGGGAALAAEVDKARGRQERIAAAVKGLAGEPGAAPQLERVLAHAAVLCE
ncbi:hypothetical protein ABPG75_005838 [Micractinium tetrahymenae]